MLQTSDFHEVRFPTDIALRSSAGPERRTEIVALGSGKEKRNQRWFQSRRRYEAGYGVKDLNTMHQVLEFYEARRGPLYGFRFKDPIDWKSCPPLQDPQVNDEVLGIGDGAKQDYQLIKSYGPPHYVYQRVIEKPVAGSVQLAVDEVLLNEGADYTLDTTTGLIHFLDHAIPAVDHVVTAGFEFDVPVRFEQDQLTVSLAGFNAGDVPSIPLVEIKL